MWVPGGLGLHVPRSGLVVPPQACSSSFVLHPWMSVSSRLPRTKNTCQVWFLLLQPLWGPVRSVGSLAMSHFSLSSVTTWAPALPFCTGSAVPASRWPRHPPLGSAPAAGSATALPLPLLPRASPVLASDVTSGKSFFNPNHGLFDCRRVVILSISLAVLSHFSGMLRSERFWSHVRSLWEEGAVTILCWKHLWWYLHPFVYSHSHWWYFCWPNISVPFPMVPSPAEGLLLPTWLDSRVTIDLSWPVKRRQRWWCHFWAEVLLTSIRCSASLAVHQEWQNGDRCLAPPWECAPVGSSW